MNFKIYYQHKLRTTIPPDCTNLPFIKFIISNKVKIIRKLHSMYQIILMQRVSIPIVKKKLNKGSLMIIAKTYQKRF